SPLRSCSTPRVVAVAETPREHVRLLDEERRELHDALGGQSGGRPGDGKRSVGVARGPEHGRGERGEAELELVDRRRVATGVDTLQLGCRVAVRPESEEAL